ncbi:glutathione S-transferase family protein [Falsirhodobacter algicola]|uniref:Glutathione S-transferase family protein n=1 Tax=Falsirhodobacter algicola TaxID=2692330 RepID=A0A8J8MUL6_9RHOB|nr:glutathione S-transferase family protein [Falsirhodobacter algicola]QUS36711.1 glutathione S-transferase family protein [Falsirhodobacter algicola]
MLTIYGVYRSRASRPLWLLAETGTPFTHVPVIQARRLDAPLAEDAPFNTRSDEFRAINPLGQIPVMEDDGLILTESLAITQYLARKHGGPLGPATDAEQAMIENWSLMAATALEPAALEIHLTRTAGGDSPEAQAQIGISGEKLRPALAVLERHFGRHDFLVGERFTVADLNMAECLRYAQSHTALLAQYPAVSAWLGTCQDRPAFRTMFALREAEPA